MLSAQSLQNLNDLITNERVLAALARHFKTLTTTPIVLELIESIIYQTQINLRAYQTFLGAK